MTEAPVQAREVTDAELEEAAARVRRHAWRERLSMGAGMLLGFAGIVGWIYSGIALVFLGSLFAGSLVYGALRPKHDALEEPPSADAASESVRAEMRGQIRRGWLAWIAGHAGEAMFGRVVLGVALLLGLAAGYGLHRAADLPLAASVGGGAIGGIAVGAVVAIVVGRRLRHALESSIQGRSV
jgi:hypothetical protein